MKYQVLLFYKYVKIDNPEKLVKEYRKLCESFNLKGRTIISNEGINSTVEGKIENTENFLKVFLEDSRFFDIHIKKSRSDGNSFPRLSVKEKDEIVSTRFPKDIDPTKQTGKYVKPEELHSWYNNNEEFTVIDMRNSYEFASGRFKNSIDMGMEASRDLPKVVNNISDIKDKKVLTVCTGGVRCEKMSAYLIKEGFKNVYQLHGGMHTYMEKYPSGYFLGTLFTFDERMTIDFGGKREIVGKCKICDSKTEKYQNCSNTACNLLFLVCTNCFDKNNPNFCSLKCRENAVSIINRLR